MALIHSCLALPANAEMTAQTSNLLHGHFGFPTVQGLVAGIGAPLWYINRVEKDQVCNYVMALKYLVQDGSVVVLSRLY